MFNLFKMEIYRALRSKGIIITLFIMGLISFFFVFAGTVGTYNTESINISNEFTQILSNSLLLIIWSIMISVYISGEYKNGFVKSIAGQIANRGYLAVSKLLFSIVYTIGMFVVSFIFISLAAFIFGKSNVVFGFSSDMMILWCVQFLLYVGFSCIFILITSVTRSSALGISIGIFTGCGLNTLLYSGINWAVNKIGIISNFDIGGYMVETNMQCMQLGIPNEYILRAALVGIVFIVVMTFASVQILNKRDI